MIKTWNQDRIDQNLNSNESNINKNPSNPLSISSLFLSSLGFAPSVRGKLKALIYDKNEKNVLFSG